MPSAVAEMAYAIDVDGTVIAIGAPGENAIAGAIYLTDCATLPCVPPLRIAPDDLAAGDAFGTAVRLSGDTLIATAPGPEPGAVYVYVRDGAGWTEQARLTPAGGPVGERFGISASLSGDRLAIGADRGGNGAGAAYVFVRNAGTWTQEARLTAIGGAQSDGFGSSVALDADTLLVGAPLTSSAAIPKSYARGSTYVFVRNGSSWSVQATLVATQGADGDLFGFSTDLSGDRAIVGAPYAASAQGTAYVFARNGTAWTEQAQLDAANGGAGDEFGWSVALADDAVLVGAPFAGQLAEAPCGASYRFDGPTFAESGTGAIEAPQLNELAGWSVAASGSRWIASAPGHLADGFEHAGAAYWFDGLVTIFHSGFDVNGACVAPEERSGA
ncbi:MAG TPA: hypothetical protein VHE32_06125 [Rhodanobacteraceae bacterium]|nr:hypothetical protein [Rhodanobacteraceae bacterium]